MQSFENLISSAVLSVIQHLSTPVSKKTWNTIWNINKNRMQLLLNLNFIQSLTENTSSI